MDLRSLISKMDAFEKLDERQFQAPTLTLQDVNAAVQGLTDPDQRSRKLSALAKSKGLPGLYDPISGQYVDQNGETTATGSADKDVDTKLASMGLIGQNAKTSSGLGRLFGASSLERDAQLRTQSGQVQQGWDKAKSHDAALDKTEELMKQLIGMQDARAAKKAQPVAAPASQAANPAVKKEGYLPDGMLSQMILEGLDEEMINGRWYPNTPSAPKRSVTGSVDVPKDFGQLPKDSQGNPYKPTSVYGKAEKSAAGAVQNATRAGIKGASKATSKGVPFLGAVINGAEAVMYAKDGDWLNATLSATGAVASFFPPIGTAVSYGIAAYQTATDVADALRGDATSTQTPATPTQAPNPANIPFDPKVQAWQQKLKDAGFGAELGPFGVDGKKGKYTIAAMAKHPEIKESQMSEAELITSIRAKLAVLEADNATTAQPEDSGTAQVVPPAPEDKADLNAIGDILKDPSNPIDQIVVFANGKQGAVVTPEGSAQSFIVDVTDGNTILAKGGEPTQFTVADALAELGLSNDTQPDVNQPEVTGAAIHESVKGEGLAWLIKKGIQAIRVPAKKLSRDATQFVAKHPVATGVAGGLAAAAGREMYKQGQASPTNPNTPVSPTTHTGQGANPVPTPVNPPAAEEQLPPEEIALAGQLYAANEEMKKLDPTKVDKELQGIAWQVDRALQPYQKFLAQPAAAQQ